MPIVLCSEKARTKWHLFFLVAGDSSYTNHKFSALVCGFFFFSFKVTIYSVLLESHNKITLVNMHKNRTQPKTLQCIKRHLLPRYRHFFFFFNPTKLHSCRGMLLMQLQQQWVSTIPVSIISVPTQFNTRLYYSDLFWGDRWDTFKR